MDNQSLESIADDVPTSLARFEWVGDWLHYSNFSTPYDLPTEQREAIGRRKRRPQVPVVTNEESMLDETLEQTFPASDPPSWTLVSRIGSPRRKPRSLDDFET